MQTFITHASTDFTLTAQELDSKRLHKNALEAWQLMLANFQLAPDGSQRVQRGWMNHPATIMWRGYGPVLLAYIEAMVTTWEARGYKSTVYEKASRTFEQALKLGRPMSEEYPPWMVDEAWFEALASSHRTALLVKNYSWYSQFNWPEDTGVAPLEYTYVWGTVKPTE